jgi:hypothetical protein
MPRTSTDTPKPEVVKYNLVSMQVCVPKDWSDKRVKQFADSSVPSGTSSGWIPRQDGDENLAGDPARNPCAEYEGYVHMVLDC